MLSLVQIKNIMKKITVLLIAIVLSNNIFSQIGIKAGLNLSNVYGEDKIFLDDDFSNPLKTGLRMSVFSQFGDSPYKLTIETGFSQKGFIMKDEEQDALGSVKAKSSYNINYLDLNSTVNFFVSDFISINTGLGIGVALNGKAKLEFYDETGIYEGVFQDDTDDAEIGEDISAFDLGLLLGSTFYLNENFLIDANYYLGLLTLDPDGDDSLFNHVIALSLGYAF